MNQEVIAGNISREYDGGGKKAAYDAISKLDRPKSITPTEWESLIANQTARVNRRVAIERAAVEVDLKAGQKALKQ
jgi:hypothetical protein